MVAILTLHRGCMMLMFAGVALVLFVVFVLVVLDSLLRDLGMNIFKLAIVVILLPIAWFLMEEPWNRKKEGQ